MMLKRKLFFFSLETTVHFRPRVSVGLFEPWPQSFPKVIDIVPCQES